MRSFNWQYGLWGSWLLLGIIGTIALVPLLESNYQLASSLLYREAADITSQQIKQEIQKKRAKIAYLERNIQTDLEKYANREESGKLYAQINDFVKRCRIQLVQLSPHPIESEGNFEILKITLKIQAEFAPLIQFLYRLERQIPGCRIDKISIKSPEKRRSLVESQLTIHCYLRKENVPSSLN